MSYQNILFIPSLNSGSPAMPGSSSFRATALRNESDSMNFSIVT